MGNPALEDVPRAALRGDRLPIPVVRTPLAVVVSRFPVVTETFILRELIELERQGQPVVLVPLLRERPAIVHPDARPWVARAVYTPFLSPAIAFANLRCLWRRPGAYARILLALARANARSAGMLARTLLLFPKSVYLAERLAAQGVGHVHAHFATHPGTVAWVVKQLTGISYSLTAHAHDIFVRREMLGEKLAGARFVRCVSEYNRRFLAERYPRSAAALTVVHVGVALGAEPAAARAQVPRLLCVAALKPYKGHAVLLEACARLRRAGIAFTCDLVGDGPGRARISAAIGRLGLAERVRLLGARTQEEVAALMASATAVVQPSVVAGDGQMEGIPVALMEALAAGKPVVASALSGIPELVEDGASGLLVPPGDAVALADALQRVLGDPSLASRLGAEGRRRVEAAFALEATVAALLDAIDAHRSTPPNEWAVSLGAAGVDSKVAGLRGLRRSTDSSVAGILLPPSPGSARPREAVLKLHQPRGGMRALQAARREHRTLLRLSRRLAGAGEDGVRFGVPRPLGIDDAGGAVLMAACEGQPLAARLRRLRWRSSGAHATLLRDVRRVGAWLRVFQARTRGEGEAPSLAAVVAAAEADLAAARLPRAAQERVAARLRSLPTRVERADPPAVGHHGDLWPGNILVREDGVDVLDLEGYRPGLPYEDAAYFAAQLHLWHGYPLLAGRGRRAEAAFLDGYLDGARLDPAAWALFRIAKALQILARTPAGAVGSGLRARLRRRALLRWIEGRR